MHRVIEAYYLQLCFPFSSDSFYQWACCGCILLTMSLCFYCKYM
jgi:hypothetical protein